MVYKELQIKVENRGHRKTISFPVIKNRKFAA